MVGGSHVIGGCGYRTAASSAVMAEGRHYAQFVVLRAGKSMFFGVVRPEWDVENKKDAEEHLLKNQKHCFFNAKTGRCYPGGQRWDGMDLMDGGKVVDGDRIGLLLDLTKGSITVFKNGAVFDRFSIDCSTDLGLICVSFDARLRNASGRDVFGQSAADGRVLLGGIVARKCGRVRENRGR